MAQREGYAILDHRASPGLTENVALRLGYDPTLVCEGAVMEAPTLTCVHCKVPNVIIKNPWRTRERASCYKCGNGYVCDNCAIEMKMPDYDHAPFDKKIEQAINSAQQNNRILTGI